MQFYIDYAAKIYGIYLKYVAKEDIYVYSIDEAFIDLASYLEFYKLEARAMAKMIMDDILKTTGVTPTCGIGTNLYLAKIALDILAKHSEDNIAFLDETLYKDLDKSAKQLELLLQDLRLNPKRYLHFSVFGKKAKVYEPQDEEKSE